MIVSLAVSSVVAPEISAARFVDVRDLLLQRITLGHHTFVVVAALATAIRLLPGLLKIIRADGRIRPDVAVARHLAGVKEVIEHAELKGEIMQVGCNCLPKHRQAGIAVAHLLAILAEVAEDLIVGPILLNDVNHVLDAALRSAGKGDFFRRRLHAVGFDYCRRPLRKVVGNFRFIECGQRAIHQRADVGTGALSPSALH